MRKALVLGLFFLAPLIASAAGFATQSIFLSKSSVTEGDSVKIYAVLSNNASTAFAGNVVLSDGSTKIGTSPVAIAAGGSQIVSVAWQPTAGSHTITAELVSSSGTSVEKQSQEFTIAEKPKPVVAPAFDAFATSSSAAVESSQGIQDQIGSLSPTAANVSKPAFNFFDGLRSTAADFLDSQLTSTKTKLAATPKSGVVAGDSTTSDPKIQNPWSNIWTILYTLYIYVLTILRFLIGNAGVFYPLLAILFFYFLYRTYKRFRRPAWER